MASHIQNKTIASSYSSPKIKYDVKYTAKRDSNSKVTYTFSITPWLDGSTSATQFLSGLGLKCTITVNGISGSVTLKSTSENWINNTADQKRATKKISITCGSTTANAQQTVKFVVTRPDGLGNSGKVSTSDYYVLSPALITTDCSAPTSFTASSDNFESNITLKWSGASGGTNNAIVRYYIQYCTSSNNSTWSEWKGLQSSNLTPVGTSQTTVDMSSKVSRGYYVKFRIRTEGSAGSSYYSSYKTSNSIRRKPYTKCTAPTSFSIALTDGQSIFDDIISLSWSGASSGTNNVINSYYIQYATSNDNSNWGSWATLSTVSTTKTSYSYYRINVSSKVTRGQYIKLRIRTQGSAGSSYYSDYKTSNSIRRNPYTKCTAPSSLTLTSEAMVNGEKSNSVYEGSITLTWTAGKSGENNAMSKYQIEFQQSSSTTFGSTWTKLTTTTIKSHTTSGSPISSITRGNYVRFRVKTVGSVSGYDSDYIVSSPIRRNSLPNKIPEVSVYPSLEFSLGNPISLLWNQAVDKDNNVYQYEIVVKDISTSTLTPIASITDNSYLLLLTNEDVKNNGQIQYGVKVVDYFGCETDYTWTDIITRYDISGVSIGINGKWRNCQLYVGTKTSQILNNSDDWKLVGLSESNGQEVESTEYVTSDFIEIDSNGDTDIIIGRENNQYYDYPIMCRIYCYGEDYAYHRKSAITTFAQDGTITVKQQLPNVDVDGYVFDPYKYIRILLKPINSTNTPRDILYSAMQINNLEWVEQDVSVGLNGSWVETDDRF